MMPSNENIYLISEKVETIPITDFLAGLNKRELDQRDLHNRIRKL